MVYITSWDDFVERSVQLFRAHPDKVIIIHPSMLYFLIFKFFFFINC